MIGSRCCLQIRSSTVTLPGMAAVSLASYSPAATASTTSGSVTLSIVTFSPAELEVIVAAPTGAGVVVDLSKVVDTTPPVITMLGDTFSPVLQGDHFTDPGVRVYDNIDGNIITAISRLQLCSRPGGDLASLQPADSRLLSGCGSPLAAVNTTVPSKDTEVYVTTYTARDSAGNQAVPLRRYITVTARCVCG